MAYHQSWPKDSAFLCHHCKQIHACTLSVRVCWGVLQISFLEVCIYCRVVMECHGGIVAIVYCDVLGCGRVCLWEVFIVGMYFLLELCWAVLGCLLEVFFGCVLQCVELCRGVLGWVEVYWGVLRCVTRVLVKEDSFLIDRGLKNGKYRVFSEKLTLTFHYLLLVSSSCSSSMES